jgi:prepilin-type N-terminal cleavage/methylation domain-containing protein
MRKAFTLIEILVVISIIALLIAILLPVLKNVRYSAMLSECQVRLRGIGQVQLSHAVDHDEFFPSPGGYEYGSRRDLDGGPEERSWTKAAHQHGAHIRGWELLGSIGDGYDGSSTINRRQYDLRETYYDYMQHHDDMEQSFHCPFMHQTFKDYNDWGQKEDKISTYMVYVSNNYAVKHFYYEDVGAYQRLGDTWTPYRGGSGDQDGRRKLDYDFTILASDTALGDFSPHGQPYRGVLSAHPATNGYIYEHAGQNNDWGGHVLDESQDAPLSFADADGSVQMFRANADSINDTDNWVVHNQGNHRNALLPTALLK